MARLKNSLLAKYVGGAILLMVLFWACLILVYCIPTSLVQTHLDESIQVLESEGLYPQEHVRPNSFDNFTVAIMLNEASQQGGNPLIASLESLYYSADGNTQLDNLEAALSEEAHESFTRYWHGYLVVLKPLLIFFDVREMRLIFQTAFLLLLGLSCACLYRSLKRRGLMMSAALCLALGFVGAPDAAATLPIFFSFAISLMGIIWVCLLPLDEMEKPDAFSLDFF